MICDLVSEQFQDEAAMECVLPSTDHRLEVDLDFNVSQLKKISDNQASKIWMIPIDKIQVKEDFNVRVAGRRHEEQIETIKKSIISEGFHAHEPLGVFLDSGQDHCVFVHSGHTRLTAAKRARAEGAEIHSLPCVLIPRGHNRDNLIASLVTSNTGRPLTPLERAIVVKRLLNYGHPVSRISELLNLDYNTVSRALDVMQAPYELHKMIAEEQIAYTKVAELLKVHGHKNIMGVVSQLIDQETGKVKRASPKNNPKKNHFERLVFREAPSMVRTFSEITLDPGWVHLSDEVKNRIQNHLKLLEATQVIDAG